MSNPDTRRRITRPNNEQDAQEHRVNEQKGTPTKPKAKGRQNIPDKNKEKPKGDVSQNQEGGNVTKTLTKTMNRRWEFVAGYLLVYQ